MSNENQFNEIKLEEKRESITGTQLISGRFYEEYLYELSHPRLSCAKFNEMIRSDAQIMRTLRVLTAPILGAKFTYIPEDEQDEQQTHQAKFKNLLFTKWQNSTWHEMMTEILTHVYMGFSIFEPTIKAIDSKEFGKIIVLKSLGFIDQKTIFEWDIKDSVVKRVKQFVGYGSETKDGWIPGYKLLVFSNMKIGNNFEGISILRSVYGNYIRKQLYLKLDMIGIEKMALGTPIFYAPDKVLNDPKARQELESIGSAYVAHQKAYILLSDKFKQGKDGGPGFEIKAGEYKYDAVDTALKREDAAIIDSILASFLTIGVNRAGGNAQNEGHMELFLNSLLSIAEYAGAKLDDLAHYVYVLNFGEPETRVDATILGITKNDITSKMSVITGYTNASIVEPDDKLEEYIRKVLRLPSKEFETRRKVNSGKDENKEEDENGKGK